MADELDLKELRLEIKQLRADVARLEKEKQPRRWGPQLIVAMMIPMVVAYWAPMLGLTSDPYSRFSSVSVKGPVRAESLTLIDESRIGVKSQGSITCDRPSVFSWSSEGGSVHIDEDKISLDGKRGTLILELDEKGEPVMRSIPAKK